MRRQLPQADAAFFDGVVTRSLAVDHDGVINAVSHQDCRAILDHNKEVMASGGSRTTSFGKVELCIPEVELHRLKKRYPDLGSPDKEIKLKAWKRFIGTAEAKPFKVSQPKYSAAS